MPKTCNVYSVLSGFTDLKTFVERHGVEDIVDDVLEQPIPSECQIKVNGEIIILARLADRD